MNCDFSKSRFRKKKKKRKTILTLKRRFFYLEVLYHKYVYFKFPISNIEQDYKKSMKWFSRKAMPRPEYSIVVWATSAWFHSMQDYNILSTIVRELTLHA